MPHLADTNIATRWILPNDPNYTAVRNAFFTPQARKEIIYITPQVLVEFHALATRPVEANGLGWSPETARREAANIQSIFPLLPENDLIYPLWERLIDTYGIIGRQVYDARLVAVMQSYGINSILTLNASHFRRFQGITVVEPHAFSSL